MIYIDESTQSVNIPKTWAAVGNRPQEVTNYIALDLPDEEAQYPNLEEMLADIGISEEQKAKMMEGGYVYVYDRGNSRYLPFMIITADEVMLGYSTPDGADYYAISFSLFLITRVLI